MNVYGEEYLATESLSAVVIHLVPLHSCTELIYRG